MSRLTNDQQTENEGGSYILKHERSQSILTQDSGVFSDDGETYVHSKGLHEEEYHFVEALRVIGVNKQDKPKPHYFFITVVRWNDKSQMVVFRKWSAILEFRKKVLKVTRDIPNQKSNREVIKKAASGVKKPSRRRHATLENINIADKLNSFFETVVRSDVAEYRDVVRQMFKPNEKDLNSSYWSVWGKTYLYVNSNPPGEINNGFDTSECYDEYHNEVDRDVDASRHLNEQGNAIDKSEKDFIEAHDKFNEADPNISWPIQSQTFVAICDYDASKEDLTDNIIGLETGEEVEVLDQNDIGWWLVIRNKEKPETKNGLNECGYVPASYLMMKDRTIDARVCGLSLRSDSILEVDEDKLSMCSLETISSVEGVEMITSKSVQEHKDVKVSLLKLERLKIMNALEDTDSAIDCE